MAVAVFWRELSGNWVDEPGPGQLTRVAGEAATRADSGNFEASIAVLFGVMCRQLTAQLLEGPPLRRAELSARRDERREFWVQAISTILSTLPRGYEPPVYPRRLRPRFMDRRCPSVPEAQVYVQGLPELRERELSHAVLTWFETHWPGDPFLSASRFFARSLGAIAVAHPTVPWRLDSRLRS